MPDISSIGHGSIGPINRAAGRTGPQVSAPAPERLETARGDQVELSPVARLLDQIRQLPEVRQDLIDRVRDEIKAGGYDSETKIDLAIEGIAAEIRGEMI